MNYIDNYFNLSDKVVATCDTEILEAVETFGGREHLYGAGF